MRLFFEIIIRNPLFVNRLKLLDALNRKDLIYRREYEKIGCKGLKMT